MAETKTLRVHLEVPAGSERKDIEAFVQKHHFSIVGEPTDFKDSLGTVVYTVEGTAPYYSSLEDAARKQNYELHSDTPVGAFPAASCGCGRSRC